MRKKIFVSYKRINKERVFSLVDDIVQQTGIDCWIDLKGIESGDWFANTIIRAIDECDILLFMLSKESIEVPSSGESWTQREVRFALSEGKRVIPVLIDGTTVNDCKWLKFFCSGIDSIDCDVPDQWNKLLHNLSDWCGTRSGASQPKASGDKLKGERTITTEVREKVKCDLILISVGPERLSTFKAMKDFCGLSLTMAKLMADECPTVIRVGMTREDAEVARKAIKKTGARVVYVEADSVSTRELAPQTQSRLIGFKRQVAMELSQEAQTLENKEEFEQAAEVFHKAIQIGMSIPNYDYENFSYDCERAAWINEYVLKNISYANCLREMAKEHNNVLHR